MKVFLDANILVSVVNHEYPLFPYTSRIVSLSISDRFLIYTSPLCLAIAFYFAEKKSSAKVAKARITVLARHLTISSTTEDMVKKSISNNKILDFEDGLQYYSALESNCSCIITENVKDYHFSEIEALDSMAFLEKYLDIKS